MYNTGNFISKGMYNTSNLNVEVTDNDKHTSLPR
jgi:hypothetical protein